MNSERLQHELEDSEDNRDYKLSQDCFYKIDITSELDVVNCVLGDC